MKSTIGTRMRKPNQINGKKPTTIKQVKEQQSK